jgi:hypothetical protein
MKNQTVTLKEFRKKQSTIKLRTQDVEVPELREMLDLGTDVMPIVKVRQGSLHDQLIANDTLKQQGSLTQSFLNSLAEVVDLAQANEDELQKDKIIKIVREASGSTAKRISAKALYEISLCETCITAPKFAPTELRWIAKHFPSVINRIATAIQKLTIEGGQKKITKS